MGDEKQVIPQQVAEGSTLYYAILYLRGEIKRHVLLLHALHHEISTIPMLCSDPGVARIKLEWWREETRRIESGTARHPLGQRLQGLPPDTGFDTDTLNHMIATTEEQIGLFEFETTDDFHDFLDRGPGLPWRITSSMCGTSDPDTGKHIDSIIRNSVRLDLLQDLYPLAQKGHCCIPRDKLETVGLDPQAVINNPTRTEIKTLLCSEYEDVVRQLQSALAGIPKHDRNNQLVLLVLGRLSLALGRELLKIPAPDPTSRIALTPMRRFWISWWTRTFNY